MERDNEDYNRDYRNNNNRNRNQNSRNNDEQFENYRDRYRSGGNYYGMRDEDAEYRNVRSTGSNTYGSGPVASYNANSYRGTQDSNNNQDQYRYGDPNPFMGNDRNGGYERTRGTGWRDNNDRYTNNHTDNDNSGVRDQGRDGGYSRGDNSYQYSGGGKRYGDFGRDEGRTYNQDRNTGYNAGNEDSYYDRSDFKYDSSDNNYRGGGRSNDSAYTRDKDRYLDNEDFRYSGRIQNSGNDRDDNHTSGRYSSNRNNQQSDSDGDRVSSRQNRSGKSGPDYGSSSAASGYSENGGQVRG